MKTKKSVFLGFFLLGIVIFVLNASFVSAAYTVLMNNAKNKSCTQICSEAGSIYSCSDIGTDTSGTNGDYMYYYKGSCRSTYGSCTTLMNSDGYTCGGFLTRWTRCHCTCNPKTCATLGMNCGSHPDSCGGTVSCGTCLSNEACVLGVCSAASTRTYCKYNSGNGGIACDSTQVPGNNASCLPPTACTSVASNVGEIYCYASSSCSNGTTNIGPIRTGRNITLCASCPVPPANSSYDYDNNSILNNSDINFIFSIVLWTNITACPLGKICDLNKDGIVSITDVILLQAYINSGCPIPPCTPATCSSLGKTCGTWANGTCAGNLNCGTCSLGGCYNGNCCVNKTCSANYTGQCGSLSNGCGGHVECTCPSGQTCTSGQCKLTGNILVTDITIPEIDCKIINMDVNNVSVISFAQSSSVPNNDSIAEYKWDFGDENITTLPGNSSGNINHTYTTSGPIDIILTVKSTKGLSAVDKLKILINNLDKNDAPCAVISNPEDAQHFSGGLILFDGTFGKDDITPFDSLTFNWYFDQNQNNNHTGNGMAGANFTKMFGGGEHLAFLTVDDNDNSL